MKLVFGRPLAPTQDEWSQIGQALSRGDPGMDELVGWMFEGDRVERRALFERALTRGLAHVVDAPAPLRAFFEQVEQDPAWLDHSLLEEGAQAAQLVGMAGYYVLRDMALMGGYVYFNSMNQALAGTGALHKNVTIRLAETGKWLAEATRPGGLGRFGEGFITTLRVRMVHAIVRRTLKNRVDWDSATWGLPINQVDLYATYLAFGPVTLLGARLLGVPITRRDSRAALHMWRYIGWLSGVEEQWLALTEMDGLRKLYHAFLTHRRPDDKVRALGIALREEPLSRRLPALERWPLLLRLVRRYIWHKHIANSALILGPLQKWRLGVPLWSVPWYPVLSAPFRFLWMIWHRVRGGRALEALKQRHAAAQQRLLASYFGEARPRSVAPQPTTPSDG